MCFSAEGNAIAIIKQDMSQMSSQPSSSLTPEPGSSSSPDQLPAPMNPFDGLKSEDEEEEQVMVSIPEAAEEEGDEEVDEAELEAFLDGQLAEGLTFLQDQEQNQNPEPARFCELPSKGEEALRTRRFNSPNQVIVWLLPQLEDAFSSTVAMLKQVLLSHTLRNPEDLSSSEGPAADPDSQKSHLQVPPEHPETPEGNGVLESAFGAMWSHSFSLKALPVSSPPSGEFLLLEFAGGSKESSTDEDMEVEGDIDMRRLLSSSQIGGEGAGPDLSRQLMTHLRLLQADLQYLKVREAEEAHVSFLDFCAARANICNVRGLKGFRSPSRDITRRRSL